jgi:hypothetical protein
MTTKKNPLMFELYNLVDSMERGVVIFNVDVIQSNFKIL